MSETPTEAQHRREDAWNFSPFIGSRAEFIAGAEYEAAHQSKRGDELASLLATCVVQRDELLVEVEKVEAGRDAVLSCSHRYIDNLQSLAEQHDVTLAELEKVTAERDRCMDGLDKAAHRIGSMWTREDALIAKHAALVKAAQLAVDSDLPEALDALGAALINLDT